MKATRAAGATRLDLLSATPAFLRGTFDALSAQVAVLKPDGTIVATNLAWEEFAQANGYRDPSHGRGENYLGVCDRARGAGAEGAKEIAAAIRAVASRERDFYEQEHPCATPEGERWYAARVSRFGENGGSYVVVAHEDITERRRMQMLELERLRAANVAKDEFIGLVSHELKTPITTIAGNIEILRRRRAHLAEEEQHAILAEIEREAARLRHVVDDLLALARADRGVEVLLEPVVVAPLVQRVAREFTRRSGRGVSLRIQSPGAVVEGEPLYLEQVLRNLLSNAEKYGAPAGEIELLLRAGRKEVEVSVLDRGPGLTSEEAARVFEPFYRAPRTAGRAEGMGIGLSLCKRLIEVQGGRVWARERPGGGADVGFALPRMGRRSDARGA